MPVRTAGQEAVTRNLRRVIIEWMTTPDPEQERQRLIELYAGMSDGELRQVARDAASLTETAQDILDDELERRGLDEDGAEEEAPAPAPTVEQRRLVTIRQFRDLPQALLAKGMLDSAGIDCFLGDDNMVRMDWFISNLLGGIKLKVKAEDVAAANAVLEQPVPDEFEVEGVGTYEQPRCPKCGSVDITFEPLNKPIAYTSAFVGVPVPFPRNSWKCEACGQRWQETDEPET
jgi:hypothetical protein